MQLGNRGGRILKWVLAVAVAISLALSMSAAAVARTDAPPNSARSVAERLMDETMDRSARLELVELEGCSVNSPGHVLCVFVASGETRNEELDCRFKILVETERGHAVGRLSKRTCDIDLLPKLDYERAYEAVFKVAQMQLGPETLVGLFRTSRSTFLATAVRTTRDPGAPLCALKLTARGSETGTVVVEVGSLTCAV